MSGDRKPARVPVGLLRVREHCTFAWNTTPGADQRSVDVLPSHCEECIAEVRRRGFELVDKRPDSEAR